MLEKYYLIGTHPEVFPLPRPIDWHASIRNDFLTEELCYEIEALSIVHIENSDVSYVYPDVLTVDRVFILSELAYSVLQIYEPAMYVKQVCFIEEGVDTVVNYYIPILPKVDCLSDETTFTRSRKIEKGVLLGNRIPDFSIFELKGNMDGDRVIVRLDFIESLLKRGAKGITLQEMEVGSV